MSARRSRRNAAAVLLSLGVVAAMAGLAYASVPLYRLFCQVTGYGGTTQAALQAPQAVPGTAVTVRFDANVNVGLPWRFAPEQAELQVMLGENGLAYYRVTNLSDRPIIGTATFNVTPHLAGPYFSKIECFCFEEQRLEPGASADLPVSFFVDPAIADDPETAGIRTITLSYTFFRAPDAAEVSSAGTASGTVN